MPFHIQPDHEAGEYEPELALLTACAGKSVNEIKEMDEDEKKAHAAKCAGDRGIAAKDVQDLAADNMGCPAEFNTKVKRLKWIFANIGAD